MSNSAQGTISIRRLRSGKTLFLSFVSNGIPLLQVVDTDTGDVAPNWNEAANQPTLTPTCKLSTGETVALSVHQWTYNGNLINFDGAESGGWVESHDKKFKKNPTTGAIKIIQNLASPTNYADDTLDYSVTATVDGVEYKVEKSMTIDIHKGSSGTFTGSISLERDTIDSQNPNTKLTAKLTYGVTAEEYSKDYSVKWYENDVEMSGQTAKTLTVDRDMVDSVALFRADFYVDGAIVATAGKTITDAADTYAVKMTITSDNTTVDTGKDVTVKAAVWNVQQEKVVELPSTAVWSTKIYETEGWTVVGSAASDTITVTTAHTDTADGSQRDVEVSSAVQW